LVECLDHTPGRPPRLSTFNGPATFSPSGRPTLDPSRTRTPTRTTRGVLLITAAGLTRGSHPISAKKKYRCVWRCLLWHSPSSGGALAAAIFEIKEFSRKIGTLRRAPDIASGVRYAGLFTRCRAGPEQGFCRDPVWTCNKKLRRATNVSVLPGPATLLPPPSSLTAVCECVRRLLVANDAGRRLVPAGQGAASAGTTSGRLITRRDQFGLETKPRTPPSMVLGFLGHSIPCPARVIEL